MRTALFIEVTTRRDKILTAIKIKCCQTVVTVNKLSEFPPLSLAPLHSDCSCPLLRLLLRPQYAASMSLRQYRVSVQAIEGPFK